jgi:DNA-binding MarR family transcriptional regulator
MLRTARQILDRRRLREREFNRSLFGEPAWDTLLELYVRENSGMSTLISHLQANSSLPPSTVARWLGQLEANGLLVRQRYPGTSDTLVELTNEARSALERYLAAAERL